jgi:hypothetical protein
MCPKRFTISRYHQKYCSDACAMAGHRQIMKKWWSLIGTPKIQAERKAANRIEFLRWRAGQQ